MRRGSLRGLGTCHAGMVEPFAATYKAFETPLGPVPVDRDFLDALGRRHCWRSPRRGGRASRRALDRVQAVMLRWALGARPFTMVPLLASFPHEAVWTGKSAEADARVPRFLAALADTLAASPRRICLVGGVDLAHVGRASVMPSPIPRPSSPGRAGGSRHARDRHRWRLPRPSSRRWRPTAMPGDLRALPDLRIPPRAAGRSRPPHPLSPVARPPGAVSFCAAAFE